MKLYGHADSGHAFKVKFFLEYFEHEHQYESVDIFSPRNERSSEFLKASKFAEVPTLIDGSNQLIQSNAILIYLAEKFGHFNDEVMKRRCIEWLYWEANKIGMCLPQLRANEVFSENIPSFALTQGALDWLQSRYTHDVKVLDDELNGKEYILGKQISPADFSLSGYLMYAHEAKVEIPRNVGNWLERLRKLRGWEEPKKLLKG